MKKRKKKALKAIVKFKRAIHDENRILLSMDCIMATTSNIPDDAVTSSVNKEGNDTTVTKYPHEYLNNWATALR